MTDRIELIHCLECSWAVSRDDHTPQELNSLMIDHALATDHDIDSTLVYPDLTPPASPELN